MEIIGLSGYARSGKDEAAKVMIEEHGFVRVAFADKLREVIYALNPLVLQDGEKWVHAVPDGAEIPLSHPRFLQKVINQYGWDGYKASPYATEIRRLLQRLGTEAGRQTLWDSIWIDAAFTGLPDDARVVVTDCRFPNEAQAIKDRGGKVVRINRTGVGPALSADGTAHASETSLDDWDFDYTIPNHKDLDTYRANLRVFMDVYSENQYFEKVVGL